METAQPSPGRATSWLWLTYVAIGLGLVVGYYLVPPHGAGGVARVAGYCLVSASSAAAVLAGVVRLRPEPRLPWLLLAAGQAVYTAANITYYLLHYVVGVTDFLTVSGVFYLARYPFVVVGLVLLIRHRTPGRDLPGLLDAGTLAVAAAMLSWLFLIGPYVHGGSGQPVEAMISVGYPVMDLALLTVGLRLVLGSGRRPLSFFLLTGNLVAIMTADTVFALEQLDGGYHAGNFLDGIWLVGDIALGAAALHPTMIRLADPTPTGDQRLGQGRLAVLLAAALAAPVTMLIRYAQGITYDIPVMAVASVLMFLLTIARMAELVFDQRRLAITDGLTGLYTRRFLEAQLPMEIARVRRSGGGLALFIVDVDHFKSINDRHGHPAGDRVLAEISVRLRGATRPGDVLARYGGEEFALLAPHVCLEEVGAVAERLRTRVAGGPIAVTADSWIFATVSVGACVFPAHVSDQTELIAMADRALYVAKAQGRDRAVIADALWSDTVAGGDSTTGGSADVRDIQNA
ncbi:GGDEF domain-containing protein [Frankia sp. Cppng1_Ct_nod]|uniref:GGDEF domain-containing protein n=1 Tax=Frankia sp. Cppng1_Ct_nod TaxID=2897162 RepID=UPI0013EF7AC4|nr:GGDEF domain-containing protein [Frankia sp. Cppng1_Ct_nod]